METIVTIATELVEEYPHELYENEQYDPLKQINREQGFYDPFWSFSDNNIEDWANLALPSH